MTERSADAAITVEEDGIRVEKSFTGDDFPVPAVRYDLSSTRETAVRVRIVDTIPESFPMDRVGFHPDYESENWTAYKDHRVEYERVLDPDESVETVFGIRSDNPDLNGFLDTPIIEHVPVGEEIEDVLGPESDAVREVLSGDRATLPGMEPARAAEADPNVPGGSEGDVDSTAPGRPTSDVERDAPDPRTVAAETQAAVTPHVDNDAAEADERDRTGGLTSDGEVEAVPNDGEETAEAVADEYPDIEAIAAGVDSSEPDDDTTELDDDTAEPGVTTDGIAAALADEIRSGDVADADLRLLRSELDIVLPRSVDVRISRLQSSVAEIEAYADALAEFIDEEGTGREILDGFRSRVDAVEAELRDIDDRVDAAADERSTLSADVESAEGAIAGLEETTSRVEASISTVKTAVADIGEDVTDVESSVGDVRTDLDSTAEAVTDLEETVDDVGDDIETLYDTVDSVDATASETETRVVDIEGRLERFDTEFDDVWDDLAEVDARLVDVADGRDTDIESVAAGIESVESDIEGIHEHLEELETFRERLNEAFGP